MDKVEQLIAKGAQIVGGDLVLRNKAMGQFRMGNFLMTPEGEAELAITDVEVKEAGTRKPRARKDEPAAPSDDITIDA